MPSFTSPIRTQWTRAETVRGAYEGRFGHVIVAPGSLSSPSDVLVASIIDICAKAETSQSSKLGNLDDDLSDGGKRILVADKRISGL
jgi:hypothetical protein